MKPDTYKLFVSLCESVMLAEDSTSMDIIKGLPGGKQVVKYLHDNYNLSHEQQYEEMDSIPWKSLKGFAHGGWVLLQYATGFAAIRSNTSGGYYVVYSNNREGDSVGTFYNTRGGEILSELSSMLNGKPRSIWVGHDENEVQQLQSERKKQKVDSQTAQPEVNHYYLLRKFRPMFSKAVTLAIADIKGMVANMIKNDEFDRSRKKIDRLKSLQSALESVSLEKSINNLPDIIVDALRSAVALAAMHYYPEQTIGLSRRWGGRIEPTSNNGINRLYKDINAGDTRKLAAILAFFKRTLITG